MQWYAVRKPRVHATGIHLLLAAPLCAGIPFDAALAQELPLPCSPCGDTHFVTSGAATYTISGAVGTVNQTSNNAILNWQSFNIDAGGTVNFNQPSANASALNRIYQNDPSRIFGALNANGQVYLINQNGIIFGKDSQVNVHALVASTLPDVFDFSQSLAADRTGPAFADETGTSKGIKVEAGAQLKTDSGGRVFLFAPEVINEGNIETPDGQTALAAGSKVYITKPSDANAAGLLIEVDGEGVVINGADGNATVTDPDSLLGQISAERGTVDLVGLAVNQLGRVSATTSVNVGGTVRLLARNVNSSGNPAVGGTVRLGANSVTEVLPELASKDTTVDASAQPQGRVQAIGHQVRMEQGSRIVAPGGTVTLNASTDGSGVELGSKATDDSRVLLESGSLIDVSGSDVTLSDSANSLSIKLQTAQLQNRPVQVNGTLHGKTVTVDLRKQGTLANGQKWIGTPLADLNEAAEGVTRGVGERTSVGGTVNITSQGDVIQQGATIDVSGGVLTYPSTDVKTTQLVRQGRIVDIADADPNLVYDGIFGEGLTVEHQKWGYTEVFDTPGIGGGSSHGYVEGKDAGTISFIAPNLILDGPLIGATTNGLYQRLAPTTVDNPILRPYEQRPERGKLIIGDASGGGLPTPNFRTADVVFGSAPADATPTGFDPVVDPFPSDITSVYIRPDTFGAQGMGRAEIYSNGTITLPEGSTLDLGPGGTLSLTGGVIDLQGKVTSEAGTVTVLARETARTGAPSLTLGGGAEIDVSGRWVNDSPQLNSGSAPQTFATVNGGKVDLKVVPADSGDQGATLDLQAGSRINANGGAWLKAGGALQAGSGGTISLGLVANQNDRDLPLNLTLDSTLTAYGINKGGTLSLNAPHVCISSAGCGEDVLSGTLDIAPDLFSKGGFSNYNITSNLGGITVAPGTNILLRQENLQLHTDYILKPTGTDLLSFSDLTLLADVQRTPVNLDLTVKARNTNPEENSAIWDNAGLLAAGNLTFRTGARIQADPGASVHLTSNTSLAVDGVIDAPAGDIALRLSGLGQVDMSEHLSAQTLWLGANSQLLARGTTVLTPNDQGLRQGEVLDGGKISLDASSGYVVANTGSVLDVSGVSTTFDMLASSSSPTQSAVYQPKTVYGSAGSINISAAEGALLVGADLRAAPADVAGASGGSLTLTLDASTRNTTTRQDLSDEQLALISPRSARTIELLGDGAGTIVADIGAGVPVPLSLNGKALVSASDLQQGGFADITLRSRNLKYSVVGGGEGATAGLVRFDGDVALTAQKSLSIDAAGIASDGGHATLNAPYVALGHSDDSGDLLMQQLPSLKTGPGELTINADLIDLIGTSRLLGFRSTDLNSTGDIRMRGVRPLKLGVTEYIGSLETTGDLTLTASTIYPTTLTEFTLRQCVGASDTRCGGSGESSDGVPDIGDRITFRSNGKAAGDVLSAGGSLTIDAPNIFQGGSVEAPLGALTFKAQESLTFEAGSRTSTSANGLTIPFGRVEAGSDWVYPVDVDDNGQQNLVYGVGEGKLAPPHQELNLEAPSVTIQKDAVIDQSGGGDLFASEFQPGVTGTSDVLSSNAGQESFAILPASQLSFAPYDPLEYQGSSLKVGDTIEIGAGVAGLPAGRYVLMPARYALLPGAYLVTPTSGYQDIQSGVATQQTDGSTLVSGRMVFGSTSLGDSRTSGFLVRSGDSISKLATYNTYTANDFFSSQAKSEELAVPRLPVDAGTLTLSVGKTLFNEGMLLGTAGTNGRGSAVQITGDNIAIVANLSEESTEGVLELTASSLNAFGAESLLLGGTASQEELGRRLNVTARQVEVQSGAQLTLPEVVIAATEKVQVDEGAVITGKGTVSGIADDLLVDGDGALLRVSANPAVHLQRENASAGTGLLDIAAGSSLVADHSILLDSSGDTRLDGTLETNGGSLSLSANQISLGDVSNVETGLTLDNAALARLNAKDLTLISRSGLDLYGAIDANFDTLGIEAGAIRGFENEGATARFTAGTLRLSNPDSVQASEPSVALGTGSLELNAGTLQFGAGTIGIEGFTSTHLSATEGVTALARTSAGEPKAGGVSVSGDLDLSAPVLAAEGGVDFTLAATGDLHFASLGALGSDAPVSGLSAHITLTGKSVLDEGRIMLPSGRVDLFATGSEETDDVHLGNGAVIDVSGTATSFGDKLVTSAAGSITLSANRGDVSLDAGSTLDLSAGTLADDTPNTAEGAGAGTLNVSAAHGSALFSGTLLAEAPDGSGSFSLDVGSLESFSALNTTLNGAGFSAERNVRVRTGSIDVAAGDVMQAQRVHLTADAGGIEFAGRIDASGTKAGRVELDALNDIVLRSGSRIDAFATGQDALGGEVALRSAQGGVQFLAGALIDVSPGASSDTTVTSAANLANHGGTVDVRMSRDALLTLTDSAVSDRLVLNGQVKGARQTTVEGYKAYAADPSGEIGGTEVGNDSMYMQDVQAFMLNAQALEQALGRNRDASFRIVPGLEIDATDNLSLNATWDLSQARFTYQKEAIVTGEPDPVAVDVKVPGVLTLRAGGNLSLNSSLSDGFDGVADIANTQGTVRARLQTSEAGGSWTYRLVAGADLGSANTKAVRAATDADLDAESGDFNLGTLATRAVVRTGTGSIDVAAARDVTFADGRSVIYTAGTNTDATKDDNDPTKGIPLNVPGGQTATMSLQGLPYPEGGGDVRVSAGGDINGVSDPERADTLASKQLVNDWLYRSGNSTANQKINTGWTVAFERFQQGIGALGGGDVELTAGGDVQNMSAVVPSIGRQVGSANDPLNNRVQIIGGGDLSVRAGGDIASGVFFVGRGEGQIDAGGSILSGRNSSQGSAPVYTTLALGDASFDVHAGGDLHLQTIVNPTLLAPGAGQQKPVGTLNSFFSTYSEDSGVRLTSLAGDVLLHNNEGNESNKTGDAFTLNYTAGASGTMMNVLAPTLEARSLSGDVVYGGAGTLFPASRGQLELLAADNVILSGSLNLSDADLSLLPMPTTPVANLVSQPIGETAPTVSALLDPGLGGRTFSPSPIHAGDTERVRLIALSGDIENTAASGNSVFLSKPAEIWAGGDIVNLDLVVQNLDANDVTSLRAGGDIRFPIQRDADRGTVVEGSSLGIDVYGPGRVEVEAGGNIDLGASRGIATSGNLVNTALADSGASIDVLAGLNGHEPQYQKFAEKYLTAEGEYVQDIQKYMQRYLNDSTLSESDALAAFAKLPLSAQKPLIMQAFYHELSESGHANEDAAADQKDYTRGFDAIKTLLPGESGTYKGDVNLFFSRIYTLDDGDINMLVPGGSINVGLATPPEAFGANKQASDLGIVARGAGNVQVMLDGDFEVNRSRVFAADGGSILVWSSKGDIDAGRGAKTSISAPPATITLDPNTGLPVLSLPPVLTGSGFRTAVFTPGRKGGDVQLIAPEGVINVNEAGITSAGDVFLSAPQVIGANNIEAAGSVVGAPVDTSGLGSTLAGASAVGNSASSAASSAVEANSENKTAPIAQAAFNWLEVFVEGFGEDVCKPSDQECLKREQQKQP